MEQAEHGVLTRVSVGSSVVSDSLQSHGLCNPQGSSVHGILQARILEWVACPPPGDLPNTGIEPRSLAMQVDSLPPEPPGKPLFFSNNLLLFFFFLVKANSFFVYKG